MMSREGLENQGDCCAKPQFRSIFVVRTDLMNSLGSAFAAIFVSGEYCKFHFSLL